MNTPPILPRIHDRGQRLFRNILSNYGLRVLNLVLGLVSFRLIMDSLGKEQVGLLMLAGTVVGYLSVVGMGLPGGVIKFVADCRGRQDEAGIRRVISSALVLYLGLGTFACACLLMFAAGGTSLLKIRPEDVGSARRVLAMFGVWALVSWPMQVYGQVLQGMQEFHKSNLASAVQTIVLNVGYIALALLGAPVEAMTLTLITSQLCMFAINQVMVRRMIVGCGFQWSQVSRSLCGQLTHFSLWMLVAALSGLLVYQSQNLIIGMMISLGAVAMYATQSTALNNISGINGLALSAVLPAVSDALQARDSSFVQRVVVRGTRMNLVLIAGISVAAIAMARPALHVWMGREFADHSHLWQILIAGYLFTVPFAVANQVLVAKGHVRMLGLVGLGGALLCVAASLALHKPLGLLGIALAATLPHIVSLGVCLWFYLPRIGFSAWQFLRECVVGVYASAFLAGIPVWLGTRWLGESPRLLPTLAYIAVGGTLILGATAWFGLPGEDKRSLVDQVRRFVGGLLGRWR